MTTLLLMFLSITLGVLFIMLWILNHIPFPSLEGQVAMAHFYIDSVQEQRIKYLSRKHSYKKEAVREPNSDV